MAEVVGLGELLIDLVPTVTGVGPDGADTFRKVVSGAAANVAVELARLGVASAFMGKVGADGFGRFLADTLARAGVDFGPLRFTLGAPTSLAFVSLNSAAKLSNQAALPHFDIGVEFDPAQMIEE